MPRPQDLQQLVDRLIAHPKVVGLVRYGRRRLDDPSPAGDLDLYLFVTERPTRVESLHFFWAGIPVDLAIRTLDDLDQAPLTSFDHVLHRGEIVYDATGALVDKLMGLPASWHTMPQAISKHEIAWERFCQRHVLAKARYRLEAEPLLCEFLLTTNVYWLVQSYFHVRGQPYPGDHSALEWLTQHEPPIHDLVARIYAARGLAEKLDLSERLTARVLAPVGGAWEPGEVLTLGLSGAASDLQMQGQALYKALLG